MAEKKESENGKYKVGDHIKVKLNDGRTVDATIRAISFKMARRSCKWTLGTRRRRR